MNPAATLIERAAGEIPAGLDGLSAIEAERRLAQFGPNRWVKRDRLARVREIVELLLDPMAVMLLIAAVIYFLLGETRDAVVLALALIPVLGIDVVLEVRSRQALDQLARAASPFADVVRQNQIRSVPLEEVVPGDILVLGEGRVIAADGVVRWAANLTADESSLTGEAEPKPKLEWLSDPHEAPADARFFAGSQVLSGHAFGLVTATGTGTQYGGIAALVEQTASPSPLQQQVGGLVRRLGMVAGVVAVGLFALSLGRGEPWTRALLGAVSLAMAAIPEEFPIVLTLFLSVGAWRLASRGMLVRRLASVETLGSTTVICTDKTGTLTRGEFQMTQHVALIDQVSPRDFLEMAVLACERHPTDAMERAIVAYAEAQQVSALAIAARWLLVRDYDFDPAGKHMSHVWQRAGSDQTCVIASKGAVEGILAHCDLDPRLRREALDAHSGLAAQGLRVLALAAKVMNRPGADRDEDERGLTLYGLLVFEDPLRPEVPAAVADCQRAGIRIIMITGDHALTAHAVAESAGITHEDGAMIVTGDELAPLGTEARTARIRGAAILARISPEQKYFIINALQRSGEIVAMTGDGVNDAPALQRADIGIAMGRRGTDVARATADLVLLDDNFASIAETVRQGRHILQNIQRAFLYLIAFHIPIIALAVAAPLLGLPLLLLPIHLVWLELIVHPVSAIVFQAEPAEADIMSRPPRNPDAALLPRAAVIKSSLSGAVLAIASLAIYWWHWATLGEAQARALSLIVLIAGYQVLMFAERLALPTRAMSMVPRTAVFWIAWCATALSLIVMLYVPAASQLFRVEPPAGPEVPIAIVLGALAVGWRLLLKR